MRFWRLHLDRIKCFSNTWCAWWVILFSDYLPLVSKGFLNIFRTGIGKGKLTWIFELVFRSSSSVWVLSLCIFMHDHSLLCQVQLGFFKTKVGWKGWSTRVPSSSSISFWSLYTGFHVAQTWKTGCIYLKSFGRDIRYFTWNWFYIWLGKAQIDLRRLKVTSYLTHWLRLTPTWVLLSVKVFNILTIFDQLWISIDNSHWLDSYNKKRKTRKFRNTQSSWYTHYNCIWG